MHDVLLVYKQIEMQFDENGNIIVPDDAYTFILHTDWEFRHILDLPWEENGYDNDMLHPRFVAVLLQLGDALDIDNDRFHPFVHAFAGSFPCSQKHIIINIWQSER